MVTLTDDRELDDGRSPVEEAGREEERDEDEELSSTVEEGEEAALALDVRPTEWISTDARRSETGRPPRQDGGSDGGHDEASVSVPKSRSTEGFSETELGFHCPAQSNTCQSDNLA